MAITFPEYTYLTLPAAPKWGSTTCCWFRLPSTIYVGGGVGLLSFGTADGYGACAVTQNLATDQFTLRVLDGSFRNIGTSYIRPDTWYFIALTVSATGTATFYVGMAGRAGILSAFDSYQTPTQTGQRVFGALGDGTYSDYGSVCWVKAWSAALTQAELVAEMGSSSLVRTANAFACCPLPNHTTLTDTSGQGHPITIVGPNASTIADVSPSTTITLPTLTTNLVVATVGDSRTEGVGGGGVTWPGTLQTLRTGDTIAQDGVSGMGSQGDYLRIQETVFPRWTAGGGTNTRVCLIQNGINDIANGVSLNRIRGNMLSSIDLLLTHGSNVYPVFLSELADGVTAYNAIEQDLSAALAADCATLGIKFIDFRTNTDLMNPVSSAYGGVGGDGRHLVNVGYALMGNFVDTAMDAWYSSAAYTSSVSESVTVSDSVAAARALSASASETVSVSEALASLGVYSRTTTESLAISDVLSGLAGYRSSAAETVSFADSVQTAVVLAIAVSELFSVSDAVLSRASYASSVSETLSVSDSTSSVKAVLAALSESVTISDSISTAATLSAALSESFSVSESVSSVFVQLVALAETVTIAESTNALKVLLANLAESVSISEANSAVAAYRLAIFETVSVNDSVQALANRFASLSESVSVSDSLESVKAILTTLVESITFIESTASIATLKAELSEALTVSDALNAARALFVSVTETVTLSDARSVSTGVNITETSAWDEAVNAVATLFLSLSESVNVSEYVIATFGEYFGEVKPPIDLVIYARPAVIFAAVH